jgi:hypothetical protein
MLTSAGEPASSASARSGLSLPVSSKPHAGLYRQYPNLLDYRSDGSDLVAVLTMLVSYAVYKHTDSPVAGASLKEP